MDEREPVGDLPLGLADRHVVVRGAGDLRRISTDVGAVAPQHLGLVGEPVRGAVEIRVVRVTVEAPLMFKIYRKSGKGK